VLFPDRSSPSITTNAPRRDMGGSCGSHVLLILSIDIFVVYGNLKLGAQKLVKSSQRPAILARTWPGQSVGRSELPRITAADGELRTLDLVLLLETFI
jgi:hypothetical protein